MIVTRPIIASEFKDTDQWGTPGHIYKPLNSLFQFNLDPCCTEENFKCEKYFTEKENGLIQTWGGYSVFVNPPYSRGNIDKWVAKCSEESKLANVIALLPVSTSADWFQKYCIGQTLYFVDKRIRFVGAKWVSPFSSVIVHFNSKNVVLSWKQ